MALTLHGTVADNTVVLDRKSAKPLVINGDMAVSQRGTSFTGQTGSAYTLDRMQIRLNDVGTYTITQDSDVPEGYGFSKSMKIDCTTANDSLEAADFMFLDVRFEQQDMRIFNKGTSSAKKITVAAHIKSPKTGTHVVGLFDSKNSRYCMQTYTISSANTWTKAIVTFPADTAGNEFDVDNTRGLSLQFHFAAGSNFTSGSAATAWESYTAANQTVGQVNCSDSTDNNILITGIQMEVGEFDANSIAAFQHELFGDNLARCQRYCQVYGAYSNMMIGAGLTFNATTAYRWGLPLLVEMRAVPSGALSGTCSLWNGGTGANATLGTAYSKTTNASYDMTCDSGLTNTTGLIMMLFLNTGTLTLTSEL